MSILKAIRDGVAGNATYDVLKPIVLYIVSPVLAAGVIVLLLFLSALDRASLVTGFVLGLLPSAFFIFVIFSSIVEKRAGSTDQSFLNADFELIEMQSIYRHSSRYKMRYVKRKKIRALKDGLDRYTERYNWSGKGDIKITLRDKKQEYIELQQKETWRTFEVKFPKPLKKDEETFIEVIFDLEDKEKSSIPVLSATVTEPTRSLMLKVVFPDDFVDSHIIKKVLPSPASTKSLEVHSDTMRDNEYVWTIQNPVISRCYMLQWTWLE